MLTSGERTEYMRKIIQSASEPSVRMKPEVLADVLGLPPAKPPVGTRSPK